MFSENRASDRRRRLLAGIFKHRLHVWSGAKDRLLHPDGVDGAEPHDAAHLHLLQVPLGGGPGGHLDIRIQI